MAKKIFCFVLIIAGYFFSEEILRSYFFNGNLSRDGAWNVSVVLGLVYCFALWLVFGRNQYDQK